MANSSSSLFTTLLSRARLRHCASIGRDVQALGNVWIHGEGRVHLGDRVVLDGRSAPIDLFALPGSEILLGDDVLIESGTSFQSQTVIRIGARVRIGRFCTLLDNHFHPVRGDRRAPTRSSFLVVEDDAVICARATLLQGTVVERGAVVQTGMTVSRRVRASPPCER